MELSIVLRRKPLYHVVNVFIPSVILSICQLGTFWISIESSSKVEMSMINLVAYFVFFVSISDELPDVSEEVPLILYYLVAQILAIAFTCLVQSFNTYLSTKARSQKTVSQMKMESIFVSDHIDKQNLILKVNPVPKWLRRLKYFADAVTFSKPKRKIISDKSVQMKEIWLLDNVWSTRGSYETDFICIYNRGGVWQNRSKLKNAHQDEINSMKRKFHRRTINNQLEWFTVAMSIRRMVFVFYTLFIIVAPLLFFYVLPPRHPGRIDRPDAYRYPEEE